MLLRGACEDLLFLVGLVGYTILRKVEGSFLYSEEVFTGHQGDFHEKGMAGKEIRIRLPGIPDGPDMDLEGPPGKGAYRRTASAGQSRQEEPSGTWWWGGLTMESIRQLLAEQSHSLLQAQQMRRVPCRPLKIARP